MEARQNSVGDFQLILDDFSIHGMRSFPRWRILWECLHRDNMVCQESSQINVFVFWLRHFFWSERATHRPGNMYMMTINGHSVQSRRGGRTKKTVVGMRTGTFGECFYGWVHSHDQICHTSCMFCTNIYMYCIYYAPACCPAPKTKHWIFQQAVVLSLVHWKLGSILEFDHFFPLKLWRNYEFLVFHVWFDCLGLFKVMFLIVQWDKSLFIQDRLWIFFPGDTSWSLSLLPIFEFPTLFQCQVSRRFL